MPEIGTSGSMSEDGKRRVAKRPKLPRLTSTLPKRTYRDFCYLSAFGGKADISHRLPNNRDLRVRRQLDVLKPQALPTRASSPARQQGFGDIFKQSELGLLSNNGLASLHPLAGGLYYR